MDDFHYPSLKNAIRMLPGVLPAVVINESTGLACYARQCRHLVKKHTSIYFDPLEQPNNPLIGVRVSTTCLYQTCRNGQLPRAD